MSKRILVFDSDPTSIRRLDRIVTHGGFSVSMASQPDSAIHIVSTRPLAAAIVSHAGNDPAALEVLETIKRVQPHCPRIALADHTDFHALVDIVNHGEIHHVVPLPCSDEQVLQAVQHVQDASRRKIISAASQLKGQHQKQARMLDLCIADDLLRLAVQPIVDVRGEQPVPYAYEALLRCTHPVLNSPLAIVQACELHGRIHDLGSLVMSQAASWLPRIPEDASLFINVHPAQLRQPDTLLNALEPLAYLRDRVVLELTERTGLEDLGTWIGTLEELRTRGFRIAVDDLGAGHNSLNVMAASRPHFIKLDMSLVRNVAVDDRKQRLVEMITDFAAKTGATVIGEGVESTEEADALRACGIGLMQGYLFARPCTDRAPLADLVVSAES